MSLSAQFVKLPDRETLAARWQMLEKQAEASFFLGWTWTGSWLEAYSVNPELLQIQDSQGNDIALALIGRAMAPRLLGHTATLLLNQSGDVVADRAFVEYNGLLTATGFEDQAIRAALHAIESRNDWRVLRLSGVLPNSAWVSLKSRRRFRSDVSPVYQVNLEQVRQNGDYLSLLSSNTRSQIRRAMKDQGGNLPVVTVGTVEQAPGWLEEMTELNQGRHADNAWDDAGFRHFVATLVKRGEDDVELLRFTDASGVVGLLVNFIYRGVAMNYQSAFIAARSPKDKPGLLCHSAAVSLYASRGLDCYSLLAGKDRYKQSLSTMEEQLEWWSVERFAPRLEAEAWIRHLLKRPAGA